MTRGRLALLGAGRLCVALACVGLAACVLPPTDYEPEAAIPLVEVDYGAWDSLLHAHVRDGVVDYPAIARGAALQSFLDDVRVVALPEPPSEGELPEDPLFDERLAFWINAYNAVTIQGILEGGSPASLWGRAGFFLHSRHAVAGEQITLWDLEHHRIRPMGDPRIHFALVCASSSCPRLASEAFLPETLFEQLDTATRRFVNDPTRNEFDRAAKVARLSQIFSWYEEDFLAESESVAQWVAPYVDDEALADELGAGGWKVKHLPYDWSLNGPPP